MVYTLNHYVHLHPLQLIHVKISRKRGIGKQIFSVFIDQEMTNLVH